MSSAANKELVSARGPVAGATGVHGLLQELPAFVYEVRGYWEGRPQLTFMSSRVYITGHDVNHWADDYAQVTELMHPHDLPAHTEMRRLARGGQDIVKAEYRERSVNGEYIWVLDVCKRTYDASGKLLLSGFCMDITARKHHEARVAARERRLRAVMEAGSSQVIELDSGGQLVYASAPSIKGFPPDAFASEHPADWMNAIVDKDRDRVRFVLLDAINRRTGCDVQFRFARLDGSVGAIKLVLTYSAGDVAAPGWVGVLTDISQLYGLSRRARFAEERARAAIHRAGALVYRWRHYGACLGLGPYEQAPRMEIHPDDLNQFNAAHRELADSQGWREVDFRWRRGGEPWRWVRSTACSMGDGTTVFGVFRPDDNSLVRELERKTVLAKLSTREEQVLKLLLTGSTNRSIARTLQVSEKTASHHVANLLDKLNLPNRASAAALAARLFGQGTT